MEEVIVRTKGLRISPRKVAIVADAIRNLPLDEALNILPTMEKRGAYVIGKSLNSAIANAVNNATLSRETLRIKRVEVTEGAFLKRFRPSTRGRVHPYKRRASNLRIILEGEKK
ncbi:MAG: 50S ribosomal protein L22 [Candidatus Levybacteria bacterium]|nr:50S ribosomal protein L22 [Candidatus Levybacteria bacterium]